MGSSSKKQGKGAPQAPVRAPQLIGQQMDRNAPAIMGFPDAPPGMGPPGMGPPGVGPQGAGPPGQDPAREQRMRAMLAQMMQNDAMAKRSQMMETGGRGGRGMGGAFGSGFGGGVGGNTPGGGYGGGKRGGGLY